MRTLLTLCCAAVAAMAMLGVSSADTMSSSAASAAATIVTPDALKWTPLKGVDGASTAVVYGDPTKAGSLYTMRIKLADGTKIGEHWHNDTERVTVLSGAVLFGSGNNITAATMKEYGPGTFVLIPGGVHHVVVAKGETILQSTGTGPFTMNMK
jgi:quercetin dioxygenase-like cupin family protein